MLALTLRFIAGCDGFQDDEQDHYSLQNNLVRGLWDSCHSEHLGQILKGSMDFPVPFGGLANEALKKEPQEQAVRNSHVLPRIEVETERSRVNPKRANNDEDGPEEAETGSGLTRAL